MTDRSYDDEDWQRETSDGVLHHSVVRATATTIEIRVGRFYHLRGCPSVILVRTIQESPTSGEVSVEGHLFVPQEGGGDSSSLVFDATRASPVLAAADLERECARGQPRVAGSRTKDGSVVGVECDREYWFAMVRCSRVAQVREVLETPRGLRWIQERETKANGATALHIASENGCAELAELLVSKGAEVSERNAMGETPLHCAVASALVQAHRNTRVCVEALLRLGADPNARDNLGRMVINLVGDETHLVTVLDSPRAPTPTLEDAGETWEQPGVWETLRNAKAWKHLEEWSLDFREARTRVAKLNDGSPQSRFALKDAWIYDNPLATYAFQIVEQAGIARLYINDSFERLHHILLYGPSKYPGLIDERVMMLHTNLGGVVPVGQRPCFCLECKVKLGSVKHSDGLDTAVLDGSTVNSLYLPAALWSGPVFCVAQPRQVLPCFFFFLCPVPRDTPGSGVPWSTSNVP